MSVRKLDRFAEMENFDNVVQPAFEEVFRKEYKWKGKWSEMFFHNTNPIVLELGCGKGEYTVNLAQHFNNKNFIGIDIKGARIWRGAKTALEKKLDNVLFLRTRVEFLESFFTENEIDEIWITFPDPQPKKALKRLTSSRFLNIYNQILKPDAIIHLKTDSRELYDYTMQLLRFNGLNIRLSTNNLYGDLQVGEILDIKTFYEKQFLREGKKITYIKFSIPSQNPIKEQPD